MRVSKKMNGMNNHLHAILGFFAWSPSDGNRRKLDKVKLRLKRKKIIVDRCKELGGGAYGTVFQINKDTVLKVSEDRTEINTMNIVKNHPMPYIVRVLDVFRCRIANRTFYFIIEELLKQAMGPWKDFADYAMAPVDDVCITRRSVKRAKKTPAIELQHLQKYLPCQWKWLENVAAYFDAHKIKFADIHNNNIMRRGRQHVLIDLGVAKAPRQRVDTL